MREVPERTGDESRSHRHGNIFSPHLGSMYVHVQREKGLAHRTMVLRPWQVQALRMIVSRWFVVMLACGLGSWAYFAVQAARVPLLSRRLDHMEADRQRLDTLQRTLLLLQGRYEQVQKMLSAPVPATRSDSPVTRKVEPAETKKKGE